MYNIYSVTPADNGAQEYRLVESFDTYEDAKSVLVALEKVNIDFNCYRIIDRYV